MITRAITGATGTGVRQFVANQAGPAAGRPASDILIIAALPELAEQWRRLLPGATAMTVAHWLKLPELTAHSLIIVDEMHDRTFGRLLLPLQQIATTVWLINRDIPPRAAPVPRPGLVPNIVGLTAGGAFCAVAMARPDGDKAR